MSLSVVVRAWTVDYPEGGGHVWAYLNWALGLRRAGCEVWWLEAVTDESPSGLDAVARRRDSLAPFGLADRFVACGSTGGGVAVDVLGPEAIDGADALLDLCYNTPPTVLARARQTALVDIDPGQLQCWWSDGLLDIAPHDAYFTTGERVGAPGGAVPSCGVTWLHTPPPVDTPAWTATPAAGAEAGFSTVTHWDAAEYFVHAGTSFENSKRVAFQPYLDLPGRVPVPLELALPAGDAEEEKTALRDRGWRISDSTEVAGTPDAYRDYIQSAAGEFSCAKPSTVHLANGWVSDRTLCYLASGRPAVVQHTGASSLLSEDEGTVRFRSPDEAARALECVAADYARHAAGARSLAVERFDAKGVVTRVLERLIP